VSQADAVGEMVRSFPDRDRTVNHGHEKHGSDTDTQNHEEYECPSSTLRGCKPQDGQGYQYGDDHHGDDKIDPHRYSAQCARKVAVDTPPDQRLVDLVSAEEEWRRGQEQLTLSPTQVSASIDTDRTDDEATGQIALR